MSLDASVSLGFVWQSAQKVPFRKTTIYDALEGKTQSFFEACAAWLSKNG
ncbi:MAG: hypothetical protein AAFY26_16420 [Cyanobacteria bacterium J06638_22]